MKYKDPNYGRDYYRRRLAEDPGYREKLRAWATARNRRLGVQPRQPRAAITPEEFKQRRVAALRRHVSANITNHLKKAVRNARSRAGKLGLPCDLHVSDLEVPEMCPVLGIPLGWGGDCPRDNRISLDRVIPEMGYVPGNVRVISWRANTLKNNATVEETRRLLAYMERETANLEAPTAL